MVLSLFYIMSSSTVGYGERIDPKTDLIYEGAFRLPDEQSANSHWEYGGLALTLYPDGDPGGQSDGYPGSLYSVGRMTGGSCKLVSEFSIPAPVNSSNIENLNTATTLQPFGDITGGFFDSVLAGELLNETRGLAYLEAQPGQDAGKIYWTIWSAYNTDQTNLPSHGYSNLNISNPNAQGIWNLQHHNKMVTGYLFDVPKSWADTHLGGRYLVSGITREGGAFSKGPCIFASAPYKYDNSNPPVNGVLPTVDLIYYDSEHDTYPDYKKKDEWRGGAWLTAGDKGAVVFVGSKCIGSVCYGTAEHCADGCGGYKGYHCYPRQPQMVFYDPADLAEVASGSRNSWDVTPYATLDLRDMIPYYGECTQTQGAAYDRANGLLYLIQEKGDGTKPLIHVFSIDVSGSGVSSGVSIDTNSLPNGIENQSYEVTLSANGGVSPYSWVLERGSLPASLSLSSSGVISGTSLHSETKTFTVKVTDVGSPATTSTKELSITTVDISNHSPIISSFTASPTSLNNPGETITFNVSATDLDGDDLTYTIDFGDGTSNGSGNQVVHTYGAAGTFTATATVKDPGGLEATNSLEITVNDASLPNGTIILQNGQDGYMGNDMRLLFSGNPNVNFSGISRAGRVGEYAGVNRLVLRFDNFIGQIPSNASIVSAYLNLHQYRNDSATGHVLDLFALNRSYSSDTVCWNSPWQVPGATGAGNVESTELSSVILDKQVDVWREWDVTAYVSQVISGQQENLGFFIRSQNEENGHCRFKMDNDSDSSLRPKLVVTYTTDSEFNVSPTINSFTSTPSSLNNPGETTTFNVSATDPNGDSLTYTVNFGDGTANGSGSQAVHTYETEGTYAAEVTVDDGHGNIVGESLQITVDDVPPTKPTGVTAN